MLHWDPRPDNAPINYHVLLWRRLKNQDQTNLAGQISIAEVLSESGLALWGGFHPVPASNVAHGASDVASNILGVPRCQILFP